MKDKFKPGTVAFTKTTEEPCFVLAVSVPDLPTPNFSGVTVTVKRPVITDQGIKHLTEVFLAEELETKEEKQQRVYNDMAGVIQLGQKDKPLSTN